MILTSFVKKHYHTFFEICLWVNLIIFSIIGYFVANFLQLQYQNISPLFGGIIGFFLGLTANVIIGGFTAIKLNYYKNIENISLNVTDINECINVLIASNNSVKDSKKEKHLKRFQKATHVVTQRVNLRLRPDMGSETYLEVNTLVSFIEQGDNITVNDVNLPLFLVETENGKQGWVFSGHLMEI